MGGKYEEYFPASALESSYDHTAPSAALLKAILITSTLSLVSAYDEGDYTTEGGIAIGDDDEDTASIIAALTGLRSEISSLLPVVDDEA